VRSTLAFGDGAIVACSAGSRSNASVIESCWCPAGCSVTSVTALCSRQMSRALAFGCRAIVARCTSAGDDATVVECCWRPSASPMAGVTTLGSG
jgi:hypothetical protein